MKKYRQIVSGKVVSEIIATGPPGVKPPGLLVECDIDAPEATHYSNGKFSYVFDAEKALVTIRERRKKLLAECDWTQMPDSPLALSAKNAWASYRQQLRDFPETCDPANPVWPTPPT